MYLFIVEYSVGLLTVVTNECTIPLFDIENAHNFYTNCTSKYNVFVEVIYKLNMQNKIIQFILIQISAKHFSPTYC